MAHAPLVRIAGWGGEAQLVASTDIEPGVLLVGEYPVAFAQVGDDEDALGPWALLESLLASHETFERVDALDLKMTKWPLAAEDQQRLERLAHQYRRNPKKLAQLYHRVAANNVRYTHAGLTGYGVWPTISRSNHSCAPNARLCAARDTPLAELLLATRPIPRGTAICWNYYAEDAFLALDWQERNARLQRNFRFRCRCERCEKERGMSGTDLAGAT